MKLFLCVALVVGFAYAGQRTELVKIVKTDTVTQLDTLKFQKNDTLKITKTFLDTSILKKQDTVVATGRLIKIPKGK